MFLLFLVGFIGFDEAVLRDEQWQLVLRHLKCHENNAAHFDIEKVPPITSGQDAVKLLIG